MNRKSLLLLSTLICLPMLVMADDVRMDKHLNGLKVSAAVEGSGDSGGQDAGGSVQALKLTNNDTVAVVCVLRPGPAESGSQSPPAVMAPGESATLRLQGKYDGAPVEEMLQCHKK